MGRLLAAVCGAIPLAVGAAASVGCAQLAGIEETDGSGRPVNSLKVTRRSVGATVMDSPLDLSGLEATYFVASARSGTGFDRVMATPGTDPGTWITKLYDPAPVAFTLPDVPAPVPRLFAFPSSELQVLYSVLEHPNPQPAPDGSTFVVTVPLDTAITVNDTFQTFVVGAWLRRPFTAAEAPVGVGTTTQIGPVTFGLTAANSVAGRATPDRVTAHDAFLVLRYTGARLSGFAEASPFDQTDMVTSVTTAKMMPVVPDRTLDVEITPSTFATRYLAVRPAVSGLAMSWSLAAAPGYQIAFNAGPVLASGTLSMDSVGVTVPYGNPFIDPSIGRDWGTIFTLTTTESRRYVPAGTAAAVTLFAGMSQFVDPPSDGTPLTLPAGLPILVMLDGVLLSTDGQAIQPPDRFVEVTFITDSPAGTTAPSATLYRMEVYDLVANEAGTALDRRLALAAASNEPRFELPPETFQAGHLYTLRIISTLGGFLALAEGDFTQRNLPLAESYVDSAVIVVTP